VLSEEIKAQLMDRIEMLTESGCWIPNTTIAQHGYCWMYGYDFGNGKRKEYAHRVFYEMFKGPVSDGLQIDHLCKVRCCVNPNHLEAVTQRTNLLRGESAAAKNARRTHCPKGHPFSPENTGKLSTRENYRYCKECNRQKARLRDRRKNALSKVRKHPAI